MLLSHCKLHVFTHLSSNRHQLCVSILMSWLNFSFAVSAAQSDLLRQDIRPPLLPGGLQRCLHADLDGRHCHGNGWAQSLLTFAVLLDLIAAAVQTMNFVIFGLSDWFGVTQLYLQQELPYSDFSHATQSCGAEDHRRGDCYRDSDIRQIGFWLTDLTSTAAV